MTDALQLLTGDAQTFIDEVWARREHRHQLDPGRAQALLSLADADQLLTTAGIRTPALRLVRDGVILPEARYTRSASLAGKPLTGLVDARKLLAEFASGATVVFQGLQRYWPPLTELIQSLEARLGHPCQANAYLTPAGNQGFAPHPDTHDVFVVQTEGSKTWQLHRDGGQHELELRPGSCLYLPTGTVHSARAQHETSLHITIGVNQLTTHDLLRRAVDRALQRVPKEHLPAGDFDAANAALLRASEAALDELRSALRDVEARELLTDWQRDRFSQGPSRLAGGLLDLITPIDDQTVLRRRPNHPFVTQTGNPGQVDVLLGDRVLHIPDWVEPALRRLAELTTDFQPSDLSAELDEQSRVVLCRRLVREGLLTVRR